MGHRLHPADDQKTNCSVFPVINRLHLAGKRFAGVTGVTLKLTFNQMGIV